MPDQDPQPTDQATPVTRVTTDRATGMDIRIDRVGSGRPMVFLNGLLGLNEHWFPALAPLAHRAECLLVQPPLLEMKGRGCSVQGVLQIVLGVVESLVEEPAILVGNSLGGHIALRAAMQRPDLVRGLVLSGSSGLFERTFEKDVQHSPSREWLDRKIGELFCDRDRMRPGLVDEAYAELSRRPAARALVRLGRSAKNDHLGEELHRVQCPVLLAWGTHDVVTPPEVARQFHQSLPDARLVWLDRCGHAAQIERPRELADAILDFLDELDAGEADSRSSVA